MVDQTHTHILTQMHIAHPYTCACVHILRESSYENSDYIHLCMYRVDENARDSVELALLFRESHEQV